MDGIGRRTWVIADGYIPAGSSGPAPEMTSHDSFCVLNTGDTDAALAITIYHPDGEPSGPYRELVAARRTAHLWFNAIEDPEPIERGKAYAAVIESAVPVVVQHTRLDSRQAELGLFSTVAFAAE